MDKDKKTKQPATSDRMKALLARAGLGVAALTPILLPLFDCSEGKWPRGASE